MKGSKTIYGRLRIDTHYGVVNPGAGFKVEETAIARADLEASVRRASRERRYSSRYILQGINKLTKVDRVSAELFLEYISFDERPWATDVLLKGGNLSAAMNKRRVENI